MSKIVSTLLHTLSKVRHRPVALSFSGKIPPNPKKGHSSEPDVRHVRYVFMDIVNYTKERSIEAQTEIIGALNDIVQTSLADQNVGRDSSICLPTGDGMCVAILDPQAPFDCHMELALSIHRHIGDRNNMTADPMRQFWVRIGLGENADNVVTDINGRRNVAGAGINSASRVMDLADGAQITVTQTVYDKLSQREKYLSAFRPLSASIKHGQNLRLYQFIQEGHWGLSVGIPSAFFVPVPRAHTLTAFEAWYFAHAIRNEKLFLDNAGGQCGYAAVVLLWFLASDTVALAQRPRVEPYECQVYGGDINTPYPAFKYYMSINFWMVCELARVLGSKLSHLSEFFLLDPQSGRAMYLLDKRGAEKLKREYPEIYNQAISKGPIDV